MAADVAASQSIKTLPANLSPSLGNAAADVATVGTPALRRCDATGVTLSPSKCVFEDTKGSKTMVLWGGDSHAFMWFPAVNAIAKAKHWKFVALIEYGFASTRRSRASHRCTCRPCPSRSTRSKCVVVLAQCGA